MIQATSLEELEPLLALCRAGKLFEIVEWVKQGNPVVVPDGAGSKGARRNPLRIAMERGFHSLVKVLLEAGAPRRVGNYDALRDAVGMRRPDLAALLLQHGARVADVPMRDVIESWEAEMVNLFIANGGDLQRGKPVAWGLIHKMRPALGLLKQGGEGSLDLMKQAECALRFHSYEGSVKWVSLLLWAGADPWASGSIDPDDDEDCMNAFEWAAIAGKLDVLKLKKLVAARNPERPESIRLLELCRDSEMMAMLLGEGHRPDRLPDFGTHAINSLVSAMTWEFYDAASITFPSQRASKRIDSSRARDRMKMVHMLVTHGAKWLPKDNRVIGDVRKHMLKMAPDYLLEFLWLLNKYGAARRRDAEELLRTPSIRRLLEKDLSSASQLVAGIPEVPLPVTSWRSPPDVGS